MAAIGAFYLADEPAWNGISAADLRQAADLVKATFPTTPLMLIEAAPALGALVVPRSVDLIGFDQYGVAAPDADIVLLVKPQFEVGRSKIGGGVVTDAGLRADAVLEVLFTAKDLGLGTLGVRASPIHGTHGNVETLIHIAPGRGSDPTEWKREIERACE